jgi:serine O-acetyltransferase
MAFWTSIRSDFRFARERDPAAVSRLEILLAYPGFHALLLHRIAHKLCRFGLPIVPRLISHFSRWITGIEIHPGAEIAAPCFIDHGMGVVIGETTIMGPRGHLHQGVTLGGTSTRRERRHPSLGSDVTVGAGAQIIGAITIGDGARIGAGSSRTCPPTPPSSASPDTSSPSTTPATTPSSAYPTPNMTASNNSNNESAPSKPSASKPSPNKLNHRIPPRTNQPPHHSAKRRR